MNPPSSTSIFLATGNPHKIAELTAMLEGIPGGGSCRVLSPQDFPGVPEPEENGETFEENALLKAHYWARIAEGPALADDSGIAIDALGGRPGVLSARYAPTAEERNRKALRELSGVPAEGRTARFVCVAALADPSGNSALRRGEVRGRITLAPRGGAGFGYDPIFELTETEHAGRTMAELAPQEKNALSHRGRAFAALRGALAETLATGRVPSAAAAAGEGSRG